MNRDPALQQMSDSDESTVSSSSVLESPSDPSSCEEEGEQGSGVEEEEEAETECSTDIRVPSQDAFLGNQGPTEIVHRAVVDVESPDNYFQLFFDEILVDLMVEETNRYAEQYLSRNTPSTSSRFHQWAPCSKKEIKIFENFDGCDD